MTRFLLDMGLPRRAAADLRAQGWDVQHAAELGMQRARDEEILERGAKESRAVVTLDSDLVRILALSGLPSPSVIHLRLQRTTREVTVKVLQALVPRIEEDLRAGCIASVTRGGVRIRRLPVRLK